VKSVPGKPDIVMRKYRTAIFVNGCFWHGHYVQLAVDSLQLLVNSSCCKIPQTNREFWVNKIKRNQERDQRNYQVLHDNGWQVIVVWECQLQPKTIEQTMLQVELLLNEHFLALHHPKVASYALEEEIDYSMAAEDYTSTSS
jgi:DNA mismatch endonuclease (patch repair protein)